MDLDLTNEYARNPDSTMFWRVASGQSTTSEPDSLLTKENLTVDEILSAPYIVQEVNSSNRDAIRVLTKDNVLDDLVDKIIHTGDSAIEESDLGEQKLVACEIICSECSEIATALCARPSCLHKLFQALHDIDNKAAVENLRSVARVLAHLFAHDPRRVLLFLKENQHLLEQLVASADHLDVAETLTRFLGADDEGPSALKLEDLQWIRQTSVLEQLLDQMEKEESLGSEYAAEILAAIARARICPFTQELSSVENLQRILNYASLNSQTPKFIRALNICISLVERRRVWENAARDRDVSPEDRSSPDISEMPDPKDEQDLELRMVCTVAPRAGEFMKQLAGEQSGRIQETPYGMLQPPLGSGRLTIMALISVLLRTGLPTAEEVLIEADLLRHCLHLFHTYPFNSILHQQVTVIIAGMLEMGSDTLVSHCFGDCKLLDWLVGLPSLVTIPMNSTVETSRKSQPLQAGYSGHITQIANRLLHAGTERDLVRTFLDGHQGWETFVDSNLGIANERQDVMSWECGRPKANLDSIESIGHDPLDDEIAASMENRGTSRFGLPFKSAFSSEESDDDEDSPNSADLLFEDAEAVPAYEEEPGRKLSGEWSRFKIRQLLPAAVDDWEDLAGNPDIKVASPEKLTPRPENKPGGRQRRHPPLSPFSSSPDEAGQFSSLQDSDLEDREDSDPEDELAVRAEVNPGSATLSMPGERVVSDAELPALGGSPPALGAGILQEALQSSIQMKDQPRSEAAGLSSGAEQTGKTGRSSRSSRKARKSDKDSKLEKMRKDDNDEMMDEINASLAEGIDTEVSCKPDPSTAADAKQKHVAAVKGIGSNLIASSREQDISGSSASSWLEASKLKDTGKAKSALLLP